MTYVHKQVLLEIYVMAERFCEGFGGEGLWRELHTKQNYNVCLLYIYIHMCVYIYIYIYDYNVINMGPATTRRPGSR